MYDTELAYLLHSEVISNITRYLWDPESYAGFTGSMSRYEYIIAIDDEVIGYSELLDGLHEFYYLLLWVVFVILIIHYEVIRIDELRIKLDPYL
jgi:hypothetical protein